MSPSARQMIHGLLAFCFAIGGAGEAPVIEQIEPRALRPGATNLIVIRGQNLEDIGSAWFSFGLSKVSLREIADRLELVVATPPNANFGPAAIQLASKQGLTDYHLLMIDDLPTVHAGAAIHATWEAQSVVPPLAVEGTCTSTVADYFQVELDRGDTLRAEIVARRLGSALDSQIRILDQRGNELEFNDDDPSLGPDSRLRFLAPSAGKFLIEVRDVNYRGGRDYFYRLRLGHFPMAAIPFPLGARRGERCRVSILSAIDEKLEGVEVTVPRDRAATCVSVKGDEDKGSSYVWLAAGNLPEITEREPNNLPTDATTMTWPTFVNGRFETIDDTDYFEFTAFAGDRIEFTALSRELGSPCDVDMIVSDVDEDAIAFAEIKDLSATVLSFDCKSDGVYRLRIRELNGRGGATLAYRIKIAEREPTFQLGVDQHRFAGRPGGTVEIKVSAQRQAYSESIALSTPDLPSSWEIEDATIADKEKEGKLTIKIPVDIAPGTVVHTRLRGQGQTGQSSISRTATTEESLKQTFGPMRYPPRFLDGLISIGITEDSP